MEGGTRSSFVLGLFAAIGLTALGYKIKSANQGQFTVTDRDSNTPYIKNIRVVSTVEYYLSD